MLKLADLLLLQKNLANLSEVPYFENLITSYIKDLLSVIDYCIENYASMNSSVIDRVVSYVWTSYNHLAGTTTHNIPYEMEYLLNKAISNWVKAKFIIVTAVSDNNMGFYCWNVNVLSEINQLIPMLSLGTKDLLIAQITMPTFYAKIPLYTVPMYHEVGHFIDNLYGISKIATFQASINPQILKHLNIQGNINYEMVERHMAEYFCDLFCSCYVGDTINRFLNGIAPHAQNSFTHPATNYRIQNVNDFLSNDITSPITNAMQLFLTQVGLPGFKVMFTIPNVSLSIAEVETYRILNDQEAHGILIAYWDYLDAEFSSKAAQNFKNGFSIYNDLVVKSIRNYSIRERWSK